MLSLVSPLMTDNNEDPLSEEDEQWIDREVEFEEGNAALPKNTDAAIRYLTERIAWLEKQRQKLLDATGMDIQMRIEELAVVRDRIAADQTTLTDLQKQKEARN